MPSRRRGRNESDGSASRRESIEEVERIRILAPLLKHGFGRGPAFARHLTQRIEQGRIEGMEPLQAGLRDLEQCSGRLGETDALKRAAQYAGAGRRGEMPGVRGG